MNVETPLTSVNKKWYTSKAVWGGLVAIMAGIAPILGYTLDAGMQDQIVNAITSMAAAVGGALAVYGRLKATQSLG